ncbi:MAG: methylenetetrahydrofolate--tRNA-(uracil(54)-C(5))-methyltransferase (FADH(2)-oxidizing) TrmFO, partial [Clostridia bacterium]|nr:methylenetetrahydrofolate--tRNA-(uracil(54)-C(5))-methyltransferase (FADH(2)-oxidizing) TrmFO [Clostridia bacterium]
MNGPVCVIGAGLAGCEAAWQLASRGIAVRLYEMKPEKHSPVHVSPLFAELVCSNSLRSDEVTSAVGLLKEEMRRLGSLVMEAADKTRVPAGAALAVDRERFSAYITEKLEHHPLVEIVRQEVTEIPEDAWVIVASGPLTSDSLGEKISRMLGQDELHFYDAVAPIVSAESVDTEKAFFASRWGKGDADYLNCGMDRETYLSFVRALVSAETVRPHEGLESEEDIRIFEGCMPIEIMAARGEDTLRYGPLKPVGITRPDTGETYYAVVQLRKENRQGTMFNLVGFQTHLTFPEQRRVFSMIPGLEKAEFLRYGVMH